MKFAHKPQSYRFEPEAFDEYVASMDGQPVLFEDRVVGIVTGSQLDAALNGFVSVCLYWDNEQRLAVLGDDFDLDIRFVPSVITKIMRATDADGEYYSQVIIASITNTGYGVIHLSKAGAGSGKT